MFIFTKFQFARYLNEFLKSNQKIRLIQTTPHIETNWFFVCRNNNLRISLKKARFLDCLRAQTLVRELAMFSFCVVPENKLSCKNMKLTYKIMQPESKYYKMLNVLSIIQVINTLCIMVHILIYKAQTNYFVCRTILITCTWVDKSWDFKFLEVFLSLVFVYVL